MLLTLLIPEYLGLAIELPRSVLVKVSVGRSRNEVEFSQAAVQATSWTPVHHVTLYFCLSHFDGVLNERRLPQALFLHRFREVGRIVTLHLMRTIILFWVISVKCETMGPCRELITMECTDYSGRCSLISGVRKA